MRLKINSVYSNRPPRFRKAFNLLGQASMAVRWPRFGQNRFLRWEVLWRRREVQRSKCSHLLSIHQRYSRRNADSSALPGRAKSNGLVRNVQKRQVSTHFRRTRRQSKCQLLQGAHLRKRRQGPRPTIVSSKWLVLSTGFSTSSQGQNLPKFVAGQFARVHPSSRIAAFFTRLEPAGLFHMGDLRGEGQLYSTHEPRLSQG